jgi:tetratricopeptide (TPR) repeat protein
MKTWRIKALGIEISVPREWSLATREPIETPFGQEVVFRCVEHEQFNIQIGPSFSHSLEEIEREFRRYALGKHYTALEFGRIVVGDSEHVWARYLMGTGDWAKKYLIVFGSTEYDITASCFGDQVVAQREGVWDRAVESFRLTASAKPRSATSFLDQMREAGACYEKGYSHFRAGRYWQALQQYEQGTLVSGEFPWNYFGKAMTLMHMIEIGAMPESKIRLALALADKDVQTCLLICPNERDYKDALRVIREYRKKHENAKHRS